MERLLLQHDASIGEPPAAYTHCYLRNHDVARTRCPSSAEFCFDALGMLGSLFENARL